MIGLDTNVLLRYIVQDHPEQAKLATDFIEKNCNELSPGFISQMVLCEIAWVLKRTYKYSQEIVSQVLEEIILSDVLIIEDNQSAEKALEAFKTGKADYSDFLIGVTNNFHGCQATATFDKKAARHDLFFLLELSS